MVCNLSFIVNLFAVSLYLTVLRIGTNLIHQQKLHCCTMVLKVLCFMEIFFRKNVKNL